LARYASNSVFERGQKGHLNDYLPPTSTGIHADHTGIHADHTGVNADRNTPQSPEDAVDAPSKGRRGVRPAAAGGIPQS
jgi:hypothetical protein